jgi:hypothetical protein
VLINKARLARVKTLIPSLVSFSTASSSSFSSHLGFFLHISCLHGRCKWIAFEHRRPGGETRPWPPSRQ